MTHPFNINNKLEAHIEKWSHIEFPSTGLGYLIGTISKHPYQENFHTTHQTTTEMKRFDIQNSFMETKNTFYTLGSRYTIEEKQKDEARFSAEWKDAVNKYTEKNGFPPKSIFDVLKK